MTNQLYEIEATMLQLGGTFAKALATASRAADSVNRKKLLGTFRELFEEYDRMTTLRLQRIAGAKS